MKKIRQFKSSDKFVNVLESLGVFASDDARTLQRDILAEKVSISELRDAADLGSAYERRVIRIATKNLGINLNDAVESAKFVGSNRARMRRNNK